MNIKRLNSIFRGIKKRCYNPKDQDYYNYGERNITVCDEWYTPGSVKGWRNFRDWALSNGYSDELTIDRIDNNKGYSPDNCKWSTTKEQANNRRYCHMITYKGRTQTLAQWCEELHLNYWTMRSRLIAKRKKKWTVEEAFETKENTSLRMITYKGKTQSMKKWCEELGLNYFTVSTRLNQAGLTIEQAFSK